MRKLWVTLAVALAAGVAPVWAELKVEQVQKLLGVDRFGSAVSLDGDSALVGAPGDYLGSAYIFTREGGVWTQQARLLADDGPGRILFGERVSLDGDTALIGASEDDDNGPGSGSVYVFTREGGVWTQQAKLLAGDGTAMDFFGRWVSLDGDTALIGAPGDNNYAGSAYIFTREGGVWTQQAKLLPYDYARGDLFGFSVCVDGDSALIGAFGNEDAGPDSGAAYIFTREDGVWTQQAKLLADDGVRNAWFGYRVSLDGGAALIAAPRDSDNGIDSGSVYVFTREGGVWTQQAKLLADDGAATVHFGLGVSLDSGVALIGAPGDSDNGIASGAAYVFAREHGSWTQQAKVLPDDGAANDQLGLGVSLDGETALIGAPANGGSAYIFRVLLDAAHRLEALAGQLRSLDLDHGTESSLLAKLDSALLILTDMSEDNDREAANVLGAFINQVDAQHGKKIAAADADGLIGDAQDIIEALEADE